nr:hypothetical protein MACL_00003206 [Theileria orientalis]
MNHNMCACTGANITNYTEALSINRANCVTNIDVDLANRNKAFGNERNSI